MRRPAPDRRGWSASSKRRFGRRGISLLLLLTFLGSFSLSTAPAPASADALSDAYAKQRALEKLIARQKAQIASLTANQTALSAKLTSTKKNLSAINANLLTVRTQIVSMVVDVAQAQNSVDELGATAAQLDVELARVEAQAADRQAQLDSRRALLASRIREAYDTDRTSLLETFLSGDDFTDVLTEVGYHLDFADQDKQLAQQIVADQQVLAVLHQNVEIARQQTLEMHALAAKQKTLFDHQLADLAAARKELARMEAETKALIAQQQAQYAKLAADKARLRALLAAATKEQKQLEALIAKLVAEALRRGGIPSVYNGTLQWPMRGRITQEFGCTGFYMEPAYGSCAHFHRGIDIATKIYTPIYAAGAGKVIWSGRSPYSSGWIVVIAHSKKLVTWYGHVANGSHAPVVKAGQYVVKGQKIAYEGMTGNTTGPHLHWAVQLSGTWVNPRLFLPR
jgi:murein DD-endopeptidase MepM/ murein hydrolase activator NlpD